MPQTIVNHLKRNLKRKAPEGEASDLNVLNSSKFGNPNSRRRHRQVEQLLDSALSVAASAPRQDSWLEQAQAAALLNSIIGAARSPEIPTESQVLHARLGLALLGIRWCSEGLRTLNPGPPSDDPLIKRWTQQLIGEPGDPDPQRLWMALTSHFERLMESAEALAAAGSGGSLVSEVVHHLMFGAALVFSCAPQVVAVDCNSLHTSLTGGRRLLLALERAATAHPDHLLLLRLQILHLRILILQHQQQQQPPIHSQQRSPPQQGPDQDLISGNEHDIGQQELETIAAAPRVHPQLRTYAAGLRLLRVILLFPSSTSPSSFLTISPSQQQQQQQPTWQQLLEVARAQVSRAIDLQQNHHQQQQLQHKQQHQHVETSPPDLSNAHPTCLPVLLSSLEIRPLLSLVSLMSRMNSAEDPAQPTDDSNSNINFSNSHSHSNSHDWNRNRDISVGQDTFQLLLLQLGLTCGSLISSQPAAAHRSLLRAFRMFDRMFPDNRHPVYQPGSAGRAAERQLRWWAGLHLLRLADLLQPPEPQQHSADAHDAAQLYELAGRLFTGIIVSSRHKNHDGGLQGGCGDDWKGEDPDQGQCECGSEDGNDALSQTARLALALLRNQPPSLGSPPGVNGCGGSSDGSCIVDNDGCFGRTKSTAPRWLWALQCMLVGTRSQRSFVRTTPADAKLAKQRLRQALGTFSTAVISSATSPTTGEQVMISEEPNIPAQAACMAQLAEFFPNRKGQDALCEALRLFLRLGDARGATGVATRIAQLFPGLPGERPGLPQQMEKARELLRKAQEEARGLVREMVISVGGAGEGDFGQGGNDTADWGDRSDSNKIKGIHPNGGDANGARELLQRLRRLAAISVDV